MEVPMESGIQLGLGEGPSIKWVQCPNPAGTIGHVLRTLAHTCKLRVLSVAKISLGSQG